jgi:hypothetical protein
MKRLSRDQEKQKDEHVAALEIAAAAVSKAIEEANAVIENQVTSAIGAYNDALANASTFRDEIVGDMELYADDRSEKWHESEAGETYQSWKGEWEGIDFSELDVPDTIDDPSPSHRDDLDALPNEAGGL